MCAFAFAQQMSDTVPRLLEGFPMGSGWLFFQSAQRSPFFLDSGFNHWRNEGIFWFDVFYYFRWDVFVYNTHEG